MIEQNLSLSPDGNDVDTFNKMAVTLSLLLTGDGLPASCSIWFSMVLFVTICDLMTMMILLVRGSVIVVCWTLLPFFVRRWLGSMMNKTEGMVGVRKRWCCHGGLEMAGRSGHGRRATDVGTTGSPTICRWWCLEAVCCVEVDAMARVLKSIHYCNNDVEPGRLQNRKLINVAATLFWILHSLLITCNQQNNTNKLDAGNLFDYNGFISYCSFFLNIRKYEYKTWMLMLVNFMLVMNWWEI